MKIFKPEVNMSISASLSNIGVKHEPVINTSHPFSNSTPVQNTSANIVNNNNNNNNNSNNQEIPRPNPNRLLESFIDLSGKNVSQIDTAVLKAEINSTNLHKLRELAGSIARLNQEIDSELKVTMTTLQQDRYDKKVIEDIFIKLQQRYNRNFEGAKELEQGVLKEIEGLKNAITNGKPFSDDDLKHIERTRVSTREEAMLKEDEYFHSQTVMQQTLTSLLGQWSGLAESIERAYKNLLWFEALKMKPDNVSLVNYESEYNAGLHRINDIETNTKKHDSLIRLPDTTPILISLEKLREEAGKVYELMMALDERSKIQTSQNIDNIRCDTLRAITKYLQVKDSVLEYHEEVQSYLKDLNRAIKDNRCKPFSKSTVDTINLLSRRIKPSKVINALADHQAEQTQRITEYQNITGTWKKILDRVGSACSKANEVINLVTTVSREKFISTLEFKLPVDQTPHVVTVEENSLAINEKLAEFHKEIEDTIEIARHNKTWSGAADPTKTDKIRSNYTSLYNKYLEFSSQREGVEKTLIDAITQSESFIEKTTVPEAPANLKSYLERIGTALNNKDDYINLAADLSNEKAKIDKKHKKEQNKCDNLKNLLNSYRETYATAKTRLCRLAQSYGLGYLPLEKANDLSSSFLGNLVGLSSVPTYDEPPAPDSLHPGELIGTLNY